MRREMVERVLRRCAVAFGIAAPVCGAVSVLFIEALGVPASGSLIVAAVALGIAAYICIAVLGFMEVYSRRRERNHPIA